MGLLSTEVILFSKRDQIERGPRHVQKSVVKGGRGGRVAKPLMKRLLREDGDNLKQLVLRNQRGCAGKIAIWGEDPRPDSEGNN